MGEWIRLALDVLLIAMVGAGFVQASRLIRHLTGLQQGRVEMERFVREFSATVVRAEIGIKNLKQAARESGDDLEKLVEKALLVRDELGFLVDSADQVAERLSQSAAAAIRPDVKPEAKPTATKSPAAEAPQMSTVRQPDNRELPVPSSRAEKELLQALQKLS